MRMASMSNSNLHANGKCLSLNKWTLRSEDEGFVYADQPKAVAMNTPLSDAGAIPGGFR